MKILLVDDSRAMRMIVKRTLKQAEFGSHEVVEAANGKEALEVFAAHSPDVILCDWNMPEMNGLEFLQALVEGGNKPAFGFVTSEGTPEMREIARDNGADFFITKPFTAEQFAMVLEPVLS